MKLSETKKLNWILGKNNSDFHNTLLRLSYYNYNDKKITEKRVWQRAEFVTNVSQQQAAASFYSNMTKDEAEFVFFV